jgi:hypothetical protein
MIRLLIFASVLFAIGSFWACTPTEEECDYYQFTGTANCGDGYYPVSEYGCCPEGTPYFCSETQSCYAFCDYATSDCGSQIVKANFGGNTGGGGSTSGCDYSMSGTWTRVSTNYDCQGARINFSGSSGTITSSPNGCCFDYGDVIWTNYDDANCTIDIMFLDANTCEFLRYETRDIYFNSKNSVTIGSNTYER